MKHITRLGVLRPLNEYTYKYEYNSYTWSLTGCNILLHPPHVGLNHTPETPTCKPTVTQPHTLYNSNPGVQWIYDILLSKYLYQRIQISHSIIKIHFQISKNLFHIFDYEHLKSYPHKFQANPSSRLPRLSPFAA